MFRVWALGFSKGLFKSALLGRFWCGLGGCRKFDSPKGSGYRQFVYVGFDQRLWMGQGCRGSWSSSQLFSTRLFRMDDVFVVSA